MADHTDVLHGGDVVNVKKYTGLIMYKEICFIKVINYSYFFTRGVDKSIANIVHKNISKQ